MLVTSQYKLSIHFMGMLPLFKTSTDQVHRWPRVCRGKWLWPFQCCRAVIYHQSFVPFVVLVALLSIGQSRELRHHTIQQTFNASYPKHTALFAHDNFKSALCYGFIILYMILDMYRLVLLWCWTPYSCHRHSSSCLGQYILSQACMYYWQFRLLCKRVSHSWLW